MVCHIVAIFIPMLLFTYLAYAVIDLFIPVMGRIGTGTIPDLFIGGLVGFLVVFSMGYQVSVLEVNM